MENYLENLGEEGRNDLDLILNYYDKHFDNDIIQSIN